MEEFGTYQRTSPMNFFGGPNLPVAAFAGVRTRRMMGFCVDFVLVSILAMLLWLSMFVLSLGLSAFILPPLWPFVAFFYNGFTVSGPRMATPGMRVADLEIRGVDGAPVTFLQAAVHAVLLYTSWLFPPVFLASLFTPDKRCLHDIFAGVIVVRRP